MRYIKGFDTIRALAVMIVIVGHWGLPFSPGPVLNNIIDSTVQYGRFGVTIFFVLSGFLITSILLKEQIRSEGQSKLPAVKKFFARRVLRIFPIYYLFLLLIYVLNDPFVRSHIWYYVGYSSNLLRGENDPTLPHFWTLAVEEQFYLVWPWLILFINKKYTRSIFVFFIFIGLLSQYLSNNLWHLQYGKVAINCFDSFGLGGLYAYMRLNSESCRKFERSVRMLLPVLIFIAWKTIAISGTPIGVIFIRFADNIIALAMIIFAINVQSGWIKDYVLENKALNFIGKISYGIYLYHFTFASAYLKLFEYFTNRYPGMPKAINNEYFFYFSKMGALFFVCWLSYRFIEQPILKLKNRFEYS